MNKRRIDSVEGTGGPSAFSTGTLTQRKVVKTHPFFTKSGGDSALSQSSSAFLWISRGKATCLHGINLQPTFSPKIAGFDLDGTLINTNIRASDKKAWSWWRNVVPTKLAQLHKDGYTIVVFSNQNITRLNVWQEKILTIASSIPDVPFRIFAATQKDGYRKPMPGMWYELERIYAANNTTIDQDASFYIGDAAGRPSGPSGKDHACTDRQWAINVRLKFFTPEEYFLGLPASPYRMDGFHVSSLVELPLYIPSSTPLIAVDPSRRPSTRDKGDTQKPLSSPVSPAEIIVLVGPPCSGKTRFVQKHIQALGHNYTLLECNVLKSRTSCTQRAKVAIAARASCVFDDIHPSPFTRKYAVSLAKSLGVPARCFLFTAPVELAWHNNLFRAYSIRSTLEAAELQRRALPKEDFKNFRQQYQGPTLSEGFSEIRKINWVWDGTEEERKYWEMWTSPMK